MTHRTPLDWHAPPDVTPDEQIIQVVGGHPLVAQILAQRGYTTLADVQAFLDPAHYTPSPPEVLPDLVKAAEHLERAIRAGDRILVWGDFDVDGQTATALLIDGLRRLGGNVVYYIPHRLRESHGILPGSLQQQIDQTQPHVVLTCDTGVSAHEAVDLARSLGVTVLITDHHDLPDELPPADAVVNPKRLPSGHPLASLPGVAVAYKLIDYLFVRQNRAGDLVSFLDLVALGIVADVATQTHDTRYMLQLGMDALRQTRRAGLRALIEVSGLKRETLSAADIGFQLGPRLNAAGRLADAGPAVELLTTDDFGRAHVLASQLDGLNTQRRLQSDQIYAAAQEQIANDTSLLDWEGLVLAHPAWHPGIIGIVASRLADHYQRPVVLLSVGDDGTARGSARSVPGYDIGAAIARQANLLTRHGGHPGAAGLMLPADHIPAFRRRLSDTLRETRDPSVRPGLDVDAFVNLDDLALDLVTDLNRLAPFGEGNPRITLVTRDLQLRSKAAIGRTSRHRRLTVEDTRGSRQTVLWWNGADQPLPDGVFDLAYEIDIGTYKGKTDLQLVLVDFHRSASAPPPITRPQRQIVDQRGAPYPMQVLDQLREQYPHAVVWAEGYRQVESPGVPASELQLSPVLIVYTTPANRRLLQAAIERVEPDTVVLVAVNPPLQTLQEILDRVLALVKYCVNQQAGKTTLDVLAAAVGQSPETIEVILGLYEARGQVTVAYSHGENLTITTSDSTPRANTEELLVLFQANIHETAAYRAYFQRAAPDDLLGWDDKP
ncbi:MAG: single-stranded-DNA-specific exonuclease RecJ [Anaerolineae bacterium]|nr:single-stranded-DNA-specific exonuclease RecJ [Anaerolineae bacterium]